MATICLTFAGSSLSPTISLLGSNSYYASAEIALSGATTATLVIAPPAWSGSWEVYSDTFGEGAWAGGITAGSGVTSTHAIPGGTTFLEFVLRETSGSPAVIGTNYCFSFDGTVVACQYGGESNPDIGLTYVITSAIIDAVVGGALALTGQVELIPYVATALSALEGTIPFAVDCTIVPSGGSPLDLRDPSTLSPDNLRTWFKQAAWNYFCRCVAGPPGSFDATPPVPPPVLAPPGAGIPAPTIACDNSDICAYLNHLEQMIAQLATQLSYLRIDLRWLQRHHVPFSYLAGALHSGLTGSGEIGVSGILGLAVQVTAVPGASGEEAGDPIARFGLGWVTTGTADGWRRSVPIRHNPQWVDVEPDDTLVGYSFNPLVVANIEEFSPAL